MVFRRVPVRTARVAVSPSKRAGGAALVVDNLRTSFEIRSSNDKDPDASSVTIYNLSDEKAGGLYANQYLSLQAGYGTPQHLLFRGYLRSVNHDRDGVERITELFTGPASEIDKDVWIAPPRAAPGSEDPAAPTYRNRVRELAHGIGVDVSLDTLERVPSTYMRFYQPRHARLRDELTSVLKLVDLTWYIEGDVLFVRPEGPVSRYSVTSKAPLVISEATNMIDSPSRVEQSETGVRVRVVLTSAVSIDTPLWITSRIVSGEFKAKTITHKGDTWQGDWYTEIEGEVDKNQSFFGRSVEFVRNLIGV